MSEKSKVFQCPECGLHYYDEETAKKCEEWCSKYKSCNLEIIRFSVEAANQAKSKNEVQ